MYDPLLDLQNLQKLYKSVYEKLFNYFHVFKHSRNPFTISWLLEILNIVSLKYDKLRAGLDPRLEKDYKELLNQLLINCSLIITD